MGTCMNCAINTLCLILKFRKIIIAFLRLKCISLQCSNNSSKSQNLLSLETPTLVFNDVKPWVSCCPGLGFKLSFEYMSAPCDLFIFYLSTNYRLLHGDSQETNMANKIIQLQLSSLVTTYPPSFYCPNKSYSRTP